MLGLPAAARSPRAERVVHVAVLLALGALASGCSSLTSKVVVTCEPDEWTPDRARQYITDYEREYVPEWANISPKSVGCDESGFWNCQIVDRAYGVGYEKRVLERRIFRYRVEFADIDRVETWWPLYNMIFSFGLVGPWWHKTIAVLKNGTKVEVEGTGPCSIGLGECPGLNFIPFWLYPYALHCKYADALDYLRRSSQGLLPSAEKATEAGAVE